LLPAPAPCGAAADAGAANAVGSCMGWAISTSSPAPAQDARALLPLLLTMRSQPRLCRALQAPAGGAQGLENC
jgi:hypothetical protein